MSKHNNSGNHFKAPKSGQSKEEREFARLVASLTDGDVRGMEAYRGEVDAAVGRMFGPATRSVPPEVYHPHPAFVSGEAAVNGALNVQPGYYANNRREVQQNAGRLANTGFSGEAMQQQNGGNFNETAVTPMPSADWSQALDELAAARQSVAKAVEESPNA